MIKSYSFNELVPRDSANILILVEQEEGVYKQVASTQHQINKIGDILNIAKLGYQFKLYSTSLALEEIDDE